MKNLKSRVQNESLYSLQMYVQFIETLSNEMVQFMEQAVKVQLQANKIGKSYYDKIEADIQQRIITHNEILSAIEKEIQSRLRKKFPEIISFRQLQLMGKGLDDEIKAHAELLGNPIDEIMEAGKSDAPVIAPNFTASREKKHD